MICFYNKDISCEAVKYCNTCSHKPNETSLKPIPELPIDCPSCFAFNVCSKIRQSMDCKLTQIRLKYSCNDNEAEKILHSN